MSKQQFKVGDRVLVTRDVLDIRCAGKTGTIIEDFPFTVGRENGRYVRFDTPAESCEGPRDWVWTYNDEIKLLHEKKKYPVIVITTDGKTTTATMRKGKKVLNTATATCSDKDTFDFAEGARIAFERLQGRDPFPEEKKPERLEKLVRVNNKIGVAGLAEGKIYRIFWENDHSFNLLGTCYSGNFVDGKYFAPFSRGDVEFIPLVED